MIESTLVEQPKDISFPRLMISQSVGIVVMFFENKKGVVVNIFNDSSAWKLTEYSNSWEMSLFSDFDGIVTLQNG